MKKRIAFFLAVLLLFSMAACGSTEPEVKIRQSAPAATEPAKPVKTPEPSKQPKAVGTPAPEPTEAPLQKIEETEEPTATPEPTVPTPVPAETPAPTPEIVAITPTAPAEAPAATRSTEKAYVLNTNTMKFHLPSCSSVKDIKESNRKDVTMARDDILAQGFSPCGRCHP